MVSRHWTYCLTGRTANRSYRIAIGSDTHSDWLMLLADMSTDFKIQSGAEIPTVWCLTGLYVYNSHTSTILVCLCLSETVYKKYSVLPSGYSFLLLLHAWFSLTWLHSLVRISIPYNYYLSSVTHGSHATVGFDRFCMERNIIILYMPPHSSHLLQSLDVSYFTPLKHLYS